MDAVIKFSALGDIAMAQPTIKSLMPTPCIITSPLGKAFLKDCFSDFIVMEDKSVWSHFKVLREIRKRSFDNIIDLQCNDRSKFMAKASGAIIHTPKGYEYAKATCSRVESAREIAFSKLTPSKAVKTYVIFNAGSSPRWVSKRPPIHKWVEFAEQIKSRYNLPIKMTGSKDEIEYITSIASQLPCDVEVVAGKTNLSELKSLLENAYLTISTDSAALHISATQGTPSIGIFGATPWFEPPYTPWLKCLYDKTYYPTGERPPPQITINNYYDNIDIIEGLDALEKYL